MDDCEGVMTVPSDEGQLYGIKPGRLFVGDPGKVLLRLRETGAKYPCEIVCFNADFMAGMSHAHAAMHHAVRSWSSGEAIANTFGMEALLFASASRQCQEAMRFGLHPGENRLFIGVWPIHPGIWEDLFSWIHPASPSEWEEIPKEKQALLQKFFDISDRELSVTGTGRLPDLVLERVALLVVNH